MIHILTSVGKDQLLSLHRARFKMKSRRSALVKLKRQLKNLLWQREQFDPHDQARTLGLTSANEGNSEQTQRIK